MNVSIPDALGYSVLGFSIVFLMLIILMGIIVVLGRVLAAKPPVEEKKPARKPRAKKAKVEDEAPATEETSAE